MFQPCCLVPHGSGLHEVLQGVAGTVTSNPGLWRGGGHEPLKWQQPRCFQQPQLEGSVKQGELLGFHKVQARVALLTCSHVPVWKESVKWQEFALVGF